ncbi:hypothetical protein Syun_023427 [Stephania yunnanensis]|uniref:Uncharacterized protein n=1 Tax=Stephania yunnanensis TaxID=152371 RepID=A0AAP0I3C0_9MAGN
MRLWLRRGRRLCRRLLSEIGASEALSRRRPTPHPKPLPNYEWVSCSSGLNFTPHVITVTAGETTTGANGRYVLDEMTRFTRISFVRRRTSMQAQDEAWRRYLEYWESEDFLARSRQASTNRNTEVEGPGTGPSKHGGGSVSFVTTNERLTNTSEMPPIVNELYLQLHTVNHDGMTFIDTRSERFYPVDDEAVYLNVAGECPKGRVYDLGSLGRKKRRYADPGASTSQIPKMVPRAAFDIVVEQLRKVFFTWDLPMSFAIYDAWCRRAAIRYTGNIYLIVKKRISLIYLTEEVFEHYERMQATDEAFKKDSKQMSSNRKSEVGGPSTGILLHNIGNISARQHGDTLEKKLQRRPTWKEMFRHLHTHGHDGQSFVDQRSAKIDAELTRRLEEMSTQNPDTSIDEDVVYLEVVPEVKGRVYGLGSQGYHRSISSGGASSF